LEKVTADDKVRVAGIAITDPDIHNVTTKDANATSCELITMLQSILPSAGSNSITYATLIN
jgi:hypothetical protein